MNEVTTIKVAFFTVVIVMLIETQLGASLIRIYNYR